MSETARSRIGYTLSGLFVLFMLGASVAPKLLGMPVAEETMTALGWPAGYTVPIGILELVLTLLYIVPRTSVLASVLFMGLFGGAMAWIFLHCFRDDSRQTVRVVAFALLDDGVIEN